MYSETHIDVFYCATGEWVQTLNVKRAKPLNETGSLSVCVLHDYVHLLYLSNIYQRKFSDGYSERILAKNKIVAGELINMDNIVTQDREGRTIQKPRRRFSLREGNKSQRL